MPIERYTQQVQEGALPGVKIQPSATAEAYGSGVGSAISRLGADANQWTGILQRKEDEINAADVMAAQTAFYTQMADYMENPETGVLNTDKLSAAEGLAGRTGEQAQKIAESIAGGLKNDAQRRAFNATVDRIKLPFWKQSAEFEAGQLKQYKDNQTKGNLEMYANMALRDPYDEDTAAESAKAIEATIRSSLYGNDEAFISAAVKQQVSKVELSRISAMIAVSDTEGADKLIGLSTRLTPEDRTEANNALKGEREAIEIQAITDTVFGKFGSNELQGMQYIEENYSGQKENRLKSAYSQMVNQYNVDENNKEISDSKRMNQNYTDLFINYIAKGLPIPDDVLYGGVERKEITVSHAKSLQNDSYALANRANIEKTIRRRPEYQGKDVTAEDIERAGRSLMGVSDDDAQKTKTAFTQDAMLGNYNKEEAVRAYNNYLLSKTDLNDLEEISKKYTSDQKTALSKMTSSFRGTVTSVMNQMGIPPTERTVDMPAIMLEITDQVQSLDQHSPTFRADVAKIMRDTTIRYIERKVQERTTTGWFGRTSSGIGSKAQQGAMDIAGSISLETMKIEPRPTLRVIPPRSQQQAPIRSSGKLQALPTGQSNWGFIFPKGTAHNVTSEFIDTRMRSYGKDIHGGVDLAVPEGTPLSLPDMGIIFKISNRNSKTAGYGSILSGTMRDGRKVEIEFNHLQKGSHSYISGQLYSPNSVFAKSGNTGTTSRGPHVDLKIRIDGKLVEPEKALAMLSDNYAKNRSYYEGKRLTAKAKKEFPQQ